jgi:hypothetical protein
MKKSLFKTLLLSASLMFFTQQEAQAQEPDKAVTLIVSGSGKTPDEAKTNALRSAIEQAFGTFISSKTEILNDAIVKDEIVSVANGNIQKYEVISELQLPDGGYNTSLKATVSVTKLTTFAESKGVAVEFKGGLFAANILMQELYEKNEVTAIKNLLTTLQEISTKSFDHSISAGEAVSVENNKWSIPLTVDVKANKNFQNIPVLLEQTLAGLSLSPEEVNNYEKLNKPVFSIILVTLNKNEVYNLRNIESVRSVFEFIYSLKPAISSFSVSNNLGVKPISQYAARANDYNFIDDKNFRMFFVYKGDGYARYAGIFTKFNSYDKIDPLEYKIAFSEKWGYEVNEETNHFLFRKVPGYPQNGSGYNQDDPLFKHFPQGYQYHREKRKFYVLSFVKINFQNSLVQFNVKDILSLEEIKQLTKYEVIKKAQ